MLVHSPHIAIEGVSGHVQLPVGHDAISGGTFVDSAPFTTPDFIANVVSQTIITSVIFTQVARATPTIYACWIARPVLPGFASLNVAKSGCSIAGHDCMGGEQLLREGPKSQ